jgi:hypothetical protein
LTEVEQKANFVSEGLPCGGYPDKEVRLSVRRIFETACCVHPESDTRYGLSDFHLGVGKSISGSRFWPSSLSSSPTGSECVSWKRAGKGGRL